MCIVTATASPLWESSQINWTNFVTSFSDSIVSSSIVYNWISSFFKSLITYQNVVPISLYLTVEFVKTIQAFFIYNDVEMYDEAMNTTCIPRSWNLADDLGQIQYIFSDKTGTLTRNIMEFKKCSINGQVYQTVPSIGKDEKSPKFYDPLLNSRMNDSADPEYTPIHNFFTALSVCHSVLVSSYHTSEVEVGGVEVASIAYKASSPDESALVEASRDIGFTFIKRELNTLLLNVLGKEMRFQLLNVLEVTFSNLVQFD